MSPLEQTFAEYYRGYLSLTPGQLAALVPAAPFALDTGSVWPGNADVPRLVPLDDEAGTLPCIAVHATEKAGKHPYLPTVEVYIHLQIQSQINDGGDGETLAGTPTEDALKWLQAINQAVHEIATFQAYLLTLTQTARTGGNTLLRQLDSGIPHEHDRQDRTQTWEIKVTHLVDVSPD